ncbi:MAG: phosphoribosyltransferase family protein [Bacillota bacterium]|jgi:competence protein ComFC|nr:ComF family protein [Candidatus Fermentithermobacillaceae bacterium]
MAWRQVLDNLSRLVYGDQALCCLCNSPVFNDVGMCSKCTGDLKRQMAWVCKVCGIPVRRPLELCHECRLNLYYFDMQRSAGIYNGRLMSAIRRMKYTGERWLSRPLGWLLSQVAGQFGHVGIVVPVPLAGSSLKARGYNQARDLAAEVSSNICVPLADILEREEARGSQARLDRRDRWRNLRGTMSVTRGTHLGGIAVLLVDDVATTGATLDEAARALKSAGAGDVYCVTLARTLPYRLAEEEGC